MSGTTQCALCRRVSAADDPCTCRRVAEALRDVPQTQTFALLVRAGLTPEQAGDLAAGRAGEA